MNFLKKKKKIPFYNFQKFKLKLYLYKKIKHFEIINDDEGELQPDSWKESNAKIELIRIAR